jgi:hypothetical protein
VKDKWQTTLLADNNLAESYFTQTAYEEGDWMLVKDKLDDEKPASALDKQVGGSHYQTAIQPIEYIHANKLPFIEGNVVKYVTRWRDKNGIEDLEKCIHYLQLLIDLENKNATTDSNT